MPPGANWSTLGSKGYKYLELSGAVGGVQKVIVKGTGAAGKTKALLKGRGERPARPDRHDGRCEEPVIAQLFNYQTGHLLAGHLRDGEEEHDVALQGEAVRLRQGSLHTKSSSRPWERGRLARCPRVAVIPGSTGT